MRLKDLMKQPVETVSPDTTIHVATGQMERLNAHHLVVMDGKRIVGVVSAHDLGWQHGKPIPSDDVARFQTVAERMSEAPVTAKPTTTVREAANLLRGHQIGCLPIVDKDRLVGIVTISDLLDLIGRGAERPVAKSQRWTLKGRGPRREQNQRTQTQSRV